MVFDKMVITSTELTLKQWAKLHHRLSQDYPASHLLIRSVMRRELGFLARRHAAWQPTELATRTGSYGYYRDCIYLDWYDAAKKTFFLLKYSEYIHDDS